MVTKEEFEEMWNEANFGLKMVGLQGCFGLKMVGLRGCGFIFASGYSFSQSFVILKTLDFEVAEIKLSHVKSIK